MTISKKDDRLLHQNNIEVLYFYCKQKSRYIIKHLILKKSLIKSFVTEYVHVRTIIS